MDVTRGKASYNRNKQRNLVDSQYTYEAYNFLSPNTYKSGQPSFR